jgi:hypothetical protein
MYILFSQDLRAMLLIFSVQPPKKMNPLLVDSLHYILSICRENQQQRAEAARIRHFSNFSAISWREHVYFQWDDDEVRFVSDQHAYLDFFSASSLKQQSAGRHVAPLGHIISIPSQPVFALSPYFCMWKNKWGL